MIDATGSLARAGMRAGAATLAAALLASIGCAAGETPEAGGAGEPLDWDRATAALAECPPGDEAWRAALGLAREPERLEALHSLAAALAERCAERWEPVWTAAECRFRQRRSDDAAAAYAEALRRARAAGDPTGVACSGNRLGWIAYQRGDLPESDRRYGEALTAALRAERPDLEAFVRNNLAALRIETGALAAAREELERAAAGLARLGLGRPARVAAFNEAIILRQLGNATAARQALEALHAQAVEAGDGEMVASALLSLGNLHLDRDEPAEARALYERVSPEQPKEAIRARLGLGRAALAEGRHEEAARILGETTDAARESLPLVASFAEVFRAQAELRAGSREPARRRLERLIAESDGAENVETGWAARWILGKLLLESGRHADAARVLDEAVAILDRQGAPLNPLEEGLHFLRRKADPYAELAAALAASAPPAERASRVLDVASRAQARALRQDLAAGDAPPLRPSLGALRDGLAPRELLVSYLVGEDRGVLLAITSRASRVEPIAGLRTLRPVLKDFREALRAGDPEGAGSAAGARLFGELLAPVRDWLAGAERLYVVPDRELALLPFGALPLDSRSAGDPRARHLGDALEIALLPLAAPPEGWSGGRAPVLLAGRPRLAPDAGYPELPWAAYELSELRELWGPESTTLILEERLSPEGLRAADLAGFRTLHFASHAEASTRDPRRCGVVLSDGALLGIDEIVGLGLERSLVVLSACRSGEGEVVPGEGVIGLGWAFLRAGAAGIVVSLWTVDDAATARLMVAFHRHLREGHDPVGALALARRGTRREHPDRPEFWAPFVIVVRPADGSRGP